MRSHSGRIVSEDQDSLNFFMEFLDDLQVAQCFPLHSFLLALNRTTVDYLSLDVEASEYKVLSTIPWDKIKIKVIYFSFDPIALL